MHSAQRLLANETLHSLDAQGEFAKGEGAFVAKAPVAEPGDVLLGGVVRAVYDSQVLSASALHGRLSEATMATEDEVEWLDDHALAAPRSKLRPPCRPFYHPCRVGHVHALVGSVREEVRGFPA